MLAAGLFAGLGGAAITVGSVGNFGSNITAGRGFVAISLVAIARSRIRWVIVAAFLFGTLEAAQSRLQDVDGIPVEFLPALPWIAVVLALIVLAYQAHRAAPDRNVSRSEGGSVTSLPDLKRPAVIVIDMHRGSIEPPGTVYVPGGAAIVPDAGAGCSSGRAAAAFR